MAYTTQDLYSTRHAALIETLKSTDYASSGDWKTIIADARLLAVSSGYEVEKVKASEALRKVVSRAERKSVKAAATMLSGAGLIADPTICTAAVAPAVAQRVAALDMLRHLWLLKKSGSHKVWVLSLPLAYRNWPAVDLAGKDFGGISDRLNDTSSRFSTNDRKHLSQATQNGLKWVHKAMLVAAEPDKKKHKAILQRWFADSKTTDEELKIAAAALNDGLKKISTCIISTFLLFTDMPLNRGKADKANVNAFVFSGEKIDVIYVEAAFFGDGDMFKDLKNWTRIVVHEISHRMVKTDDHRYRHHSKGLKPDADDATFNAAKALANADSWAMFCMDCAGEMSKSDYEKVKVSA